MLIHSDDDEGGDNPLVGSNDNRLGARFTHMEDMYPEATRAIIRRVAKECGIPLSEGTYMRQKGPNYESCATIYRLRGLLDMMWDKAQRQQGENDFIGKPVGVVGMSTTYESKVAQHAAIPIKADDPARNAIRAFQKGRAWISVSTNLAAGLGIDGPVPPPNHAEVKENAAKVQGDFGRLVHNTIIELSKTA